MQMLHFLPGIRACIDDNAKSFFIDFLMPRHREDGLVQIAHQGGMRRFQLNQTVDVFFRNDQDMDRGTRMNIPERERQFCFMDDGCRDVLTDDAAEETIGHEKPTLYSESAEK